MPQTIATLRYYKETGAYGYEVSFEGRTPHHGLNTCRTKQDALDTCDSHREVVWEEVNDPESGALMVSRVYKPGSVLQRMLEREESRGVLAGESMG